MRYLGAGVVLSSVVIVGACDSKPVPPKAPPPAPTAGRPPAVPTGAPAPAATGPAAATGAAAAQGSGVVAVQGFTFPIPEGWRQMPPANAMRAAELHLPDPSGDAGRACVAVFSTAGGDVQGNIARWAGQVRDASGQPATPEVRSQAVGGVNVTTVTLRGSYVGMNEPVREGWVMHGAIVEAPGGLIFVKMTGPAERMAAAAPAFDGMMAGMTR
ncbi:MAG: hypothetical protein WD749_03215 [Phycisphaerales bacterium]